MAASSSVSSGSTPTASGQTMANGNGGGESWATRYGAVVQTASIFALVIGGLYVSAINPLNQAVEKINHEKLSIREHDEFHKTVDSFIARFDSELLRLRERSVMKDELAKYEANVSSRMEGQANRLITIENEFHGGANVGKAIDRMQTHLDELDRRILGVIQKPIDDNKSK
jgi:hypothetical protein